MWFIYTNYIKTVVVYIYKLHQKQLWTIFQSMHIYHCKGFEFTVRLLLLFLDCIFSQYNVLPKVQLYTSLSFSDQLQAASAVTEEESRHATMCLRCAKRWNIAAVVILVTACVLTLVYLGYNVIRGIHDYSIISPEAWGWQYWTIKHLSWWSQIHPFYLHFFPTRFNSPAPL